MSPVPPTLQIRRTVDPHTEHSRPRVRLGDASIQWSAATPSHRSPKNSNLTWETILWGNTEILQDDPNLLKPGQSLFILPIDGAFYQWQEKDDARIGRRGLQPSKVSPPSWMRSSNWPGNDLNPLDPVIAPGTWVIIPGGTRPFIWEAPMVSTGGTSRTFGLGPGVCGGKVQRHAGYRRLGLADGQPQSFRVRFRSRPLRN